MRTPMTLAVLAALLVAGCITEAHPLSTDADADPGQARDAAPYQLDVRVTDEPGGPGLEGAEVRVTWGRDARTDVFPDAPPIAHAVPVLGMPPETPTPTGGGAAAALTGADGTVHLSLPADRPVALAVTAPGHTREWIPAAITGPPGGTGELTVPLYERELDLVVSEAWGPAAASTHRLDGAPAAWHPNEIVWGATDEAQRGYIARLVYLDAELTWVNGPTGGGDLAIGLGESADANPILVIDEHEHQYSPGEASERFAATRWDAMDAGVNELDALYMGAATNEVLVAPLGLPYELTVHAEFDPNPPAPVYTPMPGAGLVAAVLAGLAVLAARRRRP